MGNLFYQAGAGRAAGVQDLFGAIARRYDRLNDLQSFGLHRLWKRRLVTLAAPARGSVMLDLCCGTGDVALRLAAQGAAVVGLDFSEPMLSVGRQRAAKAGVDHRRLVLVQGDALRIPFADETFDAVTISYGLRNLVGGAGFRQTRQPGLAAALLQLLALAGAVVRPRVRPKLRSLRLHP